MSAQLPALVFLAPFAAAIMLPVVGLARHAWCRPVALASVFVMSVLAVVNLVVVARYGTIRYVFGGWTAPVGIEWVDDGLAAILVVTLSVLACLAMIHAGAVETRGHDDGRARGRDGDGLGRWVVPYYTLILLLIASLVGIVFAADLFNVFVFLEVAALSGYALVGVAGGKALVAAFRYLMLGTIGASFYLMGVAYFYAATGTLNMADLATRIPALLTSKAVVGGLIFIFLGLGIKMAVVPLHGWLPDAYTHAPDAVSPFLASMVTKVVLIAWVRILFWVVGPTAEIEHIPVIVLLEEVGAIAAVVGAALALTQSTLKRIFAYGGISHVGLILIGMSLGNPTGFAGGVLYLINDTIMQAALFFLAGAALSLYGVRTVDDLGRLRARAPWMTGALVVLAMSMIGLPPTGGFFGKWYIMLGALEAQNYFGVGAVAVATLLTLAYFVRLFERMFREEPASGADTLAAREHDDDDGAVGHDAAAAEHGGWGGAGRDRWAAAPWSLKVSVGAVSAATILLGLGSDPIITFLLAVAVPPGL